MKKLIMLLALTACTPQQLARWEQVHHVDLTPAQEALIIDESPIWTEEVAGPCSEWYATAMSVGWTPQQWSRLKFIMHRESRCQPGVWNRYAGATGLLQIMPMWADDCGGTRAMLYDPTFNLACGLHILHVQGWQAWSL